MSELRQKYPFKNLLKSAKLSRRTYYCHCKEKQDKYTIEKQEILQVYAVNKGVYGRRRIYADRSYKGEIGKIAKNLLNRDFTANKPFEKLTTDVTQFNVCDDKVYLSPVMDLYNREIISYSIFLSPNFKQTREMLQGLFEKQPQESKLILHSDQIRQYQHSEYQRSLQEHNITQSMPRKVNRMDNGAMENFFDRLKVETFYGEKFKTVDEFIEKLKEYLEYYNNDRISLKLKGLSPVQYRTQSQMN